MDEAIRNILGSQPELDETKLRRHFEDMDFAFPDACVHGFDDLIPVMTNDDKDRHVLAAAVVGRADVIVTDNDRHFPASACDPYGIDVQRPDEFLRYQLDINQRAVINGLRTQAANKARPPMTVFDLLNQLEAPLPTFASAARVLLLS